MLPARYRNPASCTRRRVFGIGGHPRLDIHLQLLRKQMSETESAVSVDAGVTSPSSWVQQSVTCVTIQSQNNWHLFSVTRKVASRPVSTLSTFIS